MARRVAETVGDRDITHVVASPLERAQQTAQPLAEARGVEVVHRRAGHRVDEHLRGPALQRRRRHRQAAQGVAAPVEPVPALVGRALQGGRRPHDGRGVRRPRRRPRPRGGDRLAPAADLDDPAARRAPVVRCTTRATGSARCAASPRWSSTATTSSTLRYSEPAADLIPVRDRRANFSVGERARPRRRRPRRDPPVVASRRRTAGGARPWYAGLLAGCSNDEVGSSGDQGYVAGKGAITTLKVADRKASAAPSRAPPWPASRCRCATTAARSSS